MYDKLQLTLRDKHKEIKTHKRMALKFILQLLGTRELQNRLYLLL